LTCSLVFNSLTRPESTEEEIERLRLTSKELAPKSAMQTLGSNFSKATDKIIGKTKKKQTKAQALMDVFEADDSDDDNDDDSNSIPPQPRSPKTPPSLPLATKSGPKFPAPEQQAPPQLVLPAPPMALSEKQRGKLPLSTTQPPSLSSASPRPLTSSQRDKQFEKKKSMESRGPNFYGNSTKTVQVLPSKPTSEKPLSPRTLRLAMGQEGPRMTAVQRDLPRAPLPVEGGVGEYEGDSGAGIGVPPSKKSLSRSLSDTSQRLERLKRTPNPSPPSSPSESSSSDDLDIDAFLAASGERLAKAKEDVTPSTRKGKSDRAKTEEEKQAEIMKRLDELPRASRSDSDEEISKERLDNAKRTGGSKRRKKKPRRQTHKKKQKK
jgi:hypothetical protein